jgi:hypothetical protein
LYSWTRSTTDIYGRGYCLSPSLIVAIALYRLGHGVTFAVIADVFGVGRSSASEAFSAFVFAANAKLYASYVGYKLY